MQGTFESDQIVYDQNCLIVISDSWRSEGIDLSSLDIVHEGGTFSALAA